jgi:hypothetical protein
MENPQQHAVTYSNPSQENKKVQAAEILWE